MLLAPTIDALSRQDDGDAVGGVWVDTTFGRGGHSRALLARLGPDARLIAFDKDPQAVEAAREVAAADPRLTIVHAGFADIREELAELGIAQVDGVMMDLGISSPQIDDPGRGFSFMRDGPLDMRMDTTRGLTAAQWLAEASIDDMREVIARYGEERFAFQIAKAIAAGREVRALTTTGELAHLVAGTVRTREKGQHPATRTFQAIRIFLNQELEELARALASILELLAPGARLAVISFHSLEDRIVKQFIAAAANPGAETARLPIPERDRPQPVLLSIGRILPTDEEVSGNPRARSAVLRVAERTSVPLPAEGGTAFIRSELPVGAARRPASSRPRHVRAQARPST